MTFQLTNIGQKCPFDKGLLIFDIMLYSLKTGAIFRKKRAYITILSPFIHLILFSGLIGREKHFSKKFPLGSIISLVLTFRQKTVSVPHSELWARGYSLSPISPYVFADSLETKRGTQFLQNHMKVQPSFLKDVNKISSLAGHHIMYIISAPKADYILRG